MYRYALDPLGNRTTIASYQPQIAIPTPPDTNYTHDNDNRMLTAGTKSFSYDNNGNLIQETGGSIATYAWNLQDMLTQVVKGSNTYSYVYDALGNRVKKTVNGTGTRYVVDPTGLSSILAETDSSGNITSYYVYGMGLISKITPANQAYFYHFDGLGSTVAMSDSTGSIVNKYAYDEYGNLLNFQEAIPNPFRYVGQYGVMDEGNGLLYMRARYYDPDLGRFISKDPIGFRSGELNLYAYLANNSVNYIDPTGLEVFLVGGKWFFIRWWGGRGSSLGKCQEYGRWLSEWGDNVPPRFLPKLPKDPPWYEFIRRWPWIPKDYKPDPPHVEQECEEDDLTI
jgi:RHS repeat-associated protein